jgi:molybdenum cofactor biosynthesis enzyme MoaA
MADEKPVEELSWLRPVYMEKPASLEKYAVCKNCNQIRMHHSGEEEKCLFDASTFAVLKSPLK